MCVKRGTFSLACVGLCTRSSSAILLASCWSRRVSRMVSWPLAVCSRVSECRMSRRSLHSWRVLRIRIQVLVSFFKKFRIQIGVWVKEIAGCFALLNRVYYLCGSGTTGISFISEYQNTVCSVLCCVSVSGIRCFFIPWIRDPVWIFSGYRISDPGSRGYRYVFWRDFLKFKNPCSFIFLLIL
jgi:hypothetical protein